MYSNGRDSNEKRMKIGLFTVWAVGVGSALGGDFFGWQFTLIGGFQSALISVGFSALFFWIYAGAITELSARYKSSGGGFDFVNTVLGTKPATLMSVLSLLKLILANAATALAISSYMGQGGLPYNYKILCWFGTYGIFTFLDCIGIKHSSFGQISATILCVLLLTFSSISNFTIFKFSNISSSQAISSGLVGLLKGLPYSLQFFDGFEDIPLLMGYAEDPEIVIPRAITLCYVTVTSISLFVLVSSAGAISTQELITSEAPLMNGVEAIYGDGIISDIIAYLVVLGLIVNFFAFILFTSQQVHAIADAGYLPSILAYRHSVYDTPIYASIASSVIGLVVTMFFSLILGEDTTQNLLLTTSLMAAICSYILVLQCIIKLRHIENSLEQKDVSQRINNEDLYSLGDDPNHLRFSLNSFGARCGQCMCLLFLIGLLVLCSTSFDYSYGIIVLILLGSLMFLIINQIKNRSVREISYNALSSEHQDDHLKQLINGLNFDDDDDDLIIY